MNQIGLGHQYVTAYVISRILSPAVSLVGNQVATHIDFEFAQVFVVRDIVLLFVSFHPPLEAIIKA